MTRSSRHTADRIAATIFVILATLLLIQSFRYGLFDANRPGPGLFPGIVSAALLVVSSIWLVRGAGPQDAQPDLNFLEEEPIDAAGARRIIGVVGWTAIPLLLFESAGYLITMVIYVSGLLTFLGRVRLWVSLPATAAGVLLTAYGADALGIALPDPFHLFERLGL
jgi:hypothetical protein